MKERPILFSAEMVQAILAGTKTQTRRVACDAMIPPFYFRAQCVQGEDGPTWVLTGVENGGCYSMGPCPYGQPGDRLWVRETWADMCGNGRACRPRGRAAADRRAHIIYRADYSPGCYPVGKGWRPSVHMPHWASRLALEITEIRVQRVQEISEEDAKAEGAGNRHGVFHDAIQSAIDNVYRRNFAVLWDSINGKRGGCAWKDNPWVWALTFKCLTEVSGK